MNGDLGSIFSKIYRDKLWVVSEYNSPLSGLGSSPDFAFPYVDFVKNFITTHGIRMTVDIGHGDWAMWRDYKFDDTSYIGFDVATGLSEKNQNVYGNSTRQFVQSTQDTIYPQADLLLIKDVFQHLSNSDIAVVAAQFYKYRYVIICNDIHVLNFLEKLRFSIQFRTRLNAFRNGNPVFKKPKPINNSDIVSGEFRTLDLESKFWRPAFSHLKLITKFDFKSEHQGVTRKRVLVFESTHPSKFTL